MIADGNSIGYTGDYIIWYEFGTGVSTTSNQIWKKRIYEDNKYCYEVVSKFNKEYDLMYKTFINESDNLLIKCIKKVLRKLYEISKRPKTKLANTEYIEHVERCNVEELKMILRASEQKI